MSSVILLSSPPNIWAGSPTPVESSSPLPSPHTLLTSQLSQQTSKKFQTANVERDGFSGRFSSTRSLLGTKTGAENIPIRSPTTKDDSFKILSPKRFKSTVAIAGTSVVVRSVRDEDPIHDDGNQSFVASPKAPRVPSSLKRFNTAPAGSLTDKTEGLLVQKPPVPNHERTTAKARDDLLELPESRSFHHEKNKLQARHEDIAGARRAFGPLNLDMAISRIDWTPTKDTSTIEIDDSPSRRLPGSFSGGLFGSFGYNGDTAVVTPAIRHDIDTGPTKRRRLDMIETGVPNASTKMPPPKTATNKKPKAALKKPLTITGLATSNYLGNDRGDDEFTALDEFLSTQARALDAGHDGITSEIAKVKAVKKQRASKKTVRKSTLVSPKSAIKTVENQDALFGSASQLARDESPSLIRGALEATRKSKSHSFSSPVRTQDTEPISIESTTPQAKSGISRFTKTRGLWAAAGRDEDNALLHVDTFDIDTVDTPDLRQAFPGKDVLVQPSASRMQESKSPEKQSPSLRGGGPLRPYFEDFWDIDGMETPAGPSRSTSVPMGQMRALIPRSDNVEALTETAATKPAKTVKKRPPKKPAFAGLTTEKLQKQIAAYGFKPMKKREQMIAVLEKCWEQKHAHCEQGPATRIEPAVEEVDDTLKHGDYLSNVHSLANRPVPKERKVPKPRKPKEPQEPQLIKGKNPNGPKLVRKRKSKATLSEDNIVDVDDLVSADGNILTEAAAIALADTAIERATMARRRSPSATKAKAKPKTPTKSTAKTKAKRPATPPSSAFATTAPLGAESAASTGSSSFSVVVVAAAETDIDAQISRAITSYSAPPSTNHQRDPTWHEKILLYDPVVLEELAGWLNTVGLGAIGVDGEVSALQVREWCERRGVCCLWRGGWRGNKGVGE